MALYAVSYYARKTEVSSSLSSHSVGYFTAQNRASAKEHAAKENLERHKTSEGWSHHDEQIIAIPIDQTVTHITEHNNVTV